MSVNIRHSKPTFYRKDIDLFKPIFESAQVASGESVKDFEEKFSHYIDCTGAIAVNSGTSALHICLLALGIGRDDEVITPSYVSVAVLNAINYVNAKPVLVDIDYDTFNMSIEDTRRKVTKRTKALIMPHMFGLPCDIDELLKLGIPIIEDCSHSLGARYNNKMTGSLGPISLFSFYATKLITTGYGGMVISNSKKLLNKARDLVTPFKRERYKTRYNYKMGNLQAALGISQLEHFGYFLKRRKEIARAYTLALSRYDLKLPIRKKDRDHVFWRYVIKTKNAASVRNHLKKNGIEVMPPVYKPLHRYLLIDEKNFPIIERVRREAISLPIYPTLKKIEITRITKTLRKVLTK